MTEEQAEALLRYIDAKVDAVIQNHDGHDMSGQYGLSASIARDEFMALIRAEERE